MYDNRDHVILGFGNSKKRFFILIYPFKEEMWIDFEGLPDEAFLCALFDGTECIQSPVSSKRKKIRTFVSIDWCINEWGGSEDFVASIKKKKKSLLDEMDRFKEMLDIGDEDKKNDDDEKDFTLIQEDNVNR